MDERERDDSERRAPRYTDFITHFYHNMRILQLLTLAYTLVSSTKDSYGFYNNDVGDVLSRDSFGSGCFNIRIGNLYFGWISTKSDGYLGLTHEKQSWYFLRDPRTVEGYVPAEEQRHFLQLETNSDIKQYLGVSKGKPALVSNIRHALELQLYVETYSRGLNRVFLATTRTIRESWFRSTTRDYWLFLNSDLVAIYTQKVPSVSFRFQECKRADESLGAIPTLTKSQVGWRFQFF